MLLVASAARLGSSVDALIGAIIGGLLTIVGGYLAAAYTLGREKKNREQDQLEDFAAAIRIVRYELATDATSIDVYLKAGGQLVHELGDSQFRSVQIVLARRLPLELRLEVVHAYSMLPFATGNVAFIASGTSSDPKKAREVIESVMKDLTDAGEGLRLYLVNVLKVAEA